MNKITLDKKHSLLLVDDNLENLQALSSFLHKTYKLYFAGGGIKAVETAADIRPDLILLDIVMPDLDGFQTLARLRDNPVTAEIPVIFLTARAAPEDIVKGFEAGAVDYITKPFNQPEVLARVNTHIELKLSKDLLTQMNEQLAADLEKKKIELVVNAAARLNLIAKYKEEIRKVTDYINSNNLIDDKESGKVLPEAYIEDEAGVMSAFEQQFNVLHHDFYLRLSEAHPGLTMTDRKLCALFRLNMSSKDVMAVTNGNFHAVKQARFRLRKKLGLNPEVNLTEYLMHF